MDKASRALIEGVPHGVRNTYHGLAEYHDVARSTLHDRAHGQRSLEEKAQGQQYLTPCEEKAMVNFILQMRKFGRRVRVKEIGPLAFSMARQRLTNTKTKPPGPNWPRAFEKRHPELKARRHRPLDWNRFHIYDKVVHWFEVIGKVLQDPDVKSENVYNMDETGVMLVEIVILQVYRLTYELLGTCIHVACLCLHRQTSHRPRRGVFAYRQYATSSRAVQKQLSH